MKGRVAWAVGVVVASCRAAPVTTRSAVVERAAPSSVAEVAPSASSPAPREEHPPPAPPVRQEPSNQPDPHTFACGDARCAAGKETCCAVSSIGGHHANCVAVRAASKLQHDISTVYSVECNHGEPAMAGDLTHLTANRCDESQDCGPNEVCCNDFTSELTAQYYAVVRCVAASGKRGGPCPGEERCVSGGPPCRTNGADCVAGVCKKAPSARPCASGTCPGECASAADCLEGEHCLHEDQQGRCAARVPMRGCENDGDCRDFCGETQAKCRPDPTFAAMKMCDCARL